MGIDEKLLSPADCIDIAKEYARHIYEDINKPIEVSDATAKEIGNMRFLEIGLKIRRQGYRTNNRLYDYQYGSDASYVAVVDRVSGEVLHLATHTSSNMPRFYDQYERKVNDLGETL